MNGKKRSWEKMNTRRIALSGVMVVLAVLAVILAVVPLALADIPSSKTHPANAIWFDLETVNASYCEYKTVDVWTNTSVSPDTLHLEFNYTHYCANVTSATCNNSNFQGFCAVNYQQFPGKGIIGAGTSVTQSPLPANQPVHVATLTIHCCNETSDCETNLIWDPVASYIDDPDGNTIEPMAWHNGRFICGEVPIPTFTKDLYEGWNLASLPLTPSDNSASSVLASVWGNVTTPVYRYNATSKQFEPASIMDPGEGYFVHITQNCTWTYSSTSAYTSMSTELKQGLNMVGWLNCTKAISSLSSIDGKYWYIARWNAAEQKFEVYNPVAPSVFNDFTTMNRGEGYFISAKEGTTLVESC